VSVALVHRYGAAIFSARLGGPARARHLKQIIVVGEASTTPRAQRRIPALETFPSHRDDAAIWLFSAVRRESESRVQSHGSFANTTICYGQESSASPERDITLAVPKLFFGYRYGLEPLFPVFPSVRLSRLFPETEYRRGTHRCFRRSANFRPDAAGERAHDGQSDGRAP